MSSYLASGYKVGLSATWSAIQGAAQYRVTHSRQDACGSASVVVYTTGTSSSSGLHPNCGNPPTSCYRKSATVEALSSTGAVLASELGSICELGVP